MTYPPFGTVPDPALVQRVLTLEAENDTLRRQIKRYKRASLALFLLLVVVPFALNIALSMTNG